MNEEPYDEKHLQEYTGILTSHNARNDRFKMELKVEDNPILKERWTKQNESSIELEFKYNGGTSVMFFHNRFTCPLYQVNMECRECERINKIYEIFYANLYHLQFGDTFSIKAALINNDQSVLPAEIHSFENYQPLLAACTGSRLRLDDTLEGINKKDEREQRRKQSEEKRKKDEEQAKKEAKWGKIKEKIHDFFGKSPYITQIITSIIGGLISGLISGVFIATIVKPIPRLFRWITSLF